MYQIPANLLVTNPQSSQAAIEFLPVGSPSTADLQKFASMNNLPYRNISHVVGPVDQGFTGESTLDVEYLQSISPMAELWYITIGDGWMLDYATEAFGMNPVPWVHSISYGWPELFNCQQEVTHAHCSGITDLQYTNRANTEFMKLTSRGVSVIVCSQDEGAPSEQNEYCQLDSSQPIWSIYPAACPWVTTVSGTTVIDGSSDVVEQSVSALPPICNAGYTCAQGYLEHACTFRNTYYQWTTGGGFSSFAARPKYQDAAVKAFLAGTPQPPAKFFNAANRAYPDISAPGSRILIVQHGVVSVSAGTSASTPMIAGVVTLLNDARFNANKKQLGFLNPLLYEMKAKNGTGFHDVIYGDNKCTHAACCHYGYLCAKGYNSVTGLGTPNFGQMRTYVLNLK